MKKIAATLHSEPCSEKDLLCAVAAKSEGATWEQIRQMFPTNRFMYQMGVFCFKWMPEWSPGFRPSDPAALRAVLRNYIQKNHPGYVAPEWAAN